MSKLLGQRLREKRKRLGMTQQQVADEVNVDRTSYTYYELGDHEPTLQTLYKIAMLLGVSVDDLLKPETN